MCSIVKSKLCVALKLDRIAIWLYRYLLYMPQVHFILFQNKFEMKC